MVGVRKSLQEIFSKDNQSGLVPVPLMIVVLVVGVAAYALTSSRRRVPIDSPSTPLEAVEQILSKACPTEEELSLAAELAEKFGEEDLKERVSNKKPALWCSAVLKMKQSFSKATQRDVLADLPEECIVRDSWDMGGEPWQCRTCYAVYDTEKYRDKSASYTQTVIDEERCEEAVGKPACDALENRLDTIDCLKFDEIPVGFEDQYDFSDYQTDELDDLPIEPLPGGDAREPELEPLDPEFDAGEPELEPLGGDSGLLQKGREFLNNPIEILFGN